MHSSTLLDALKERTPSPNAAQPVAGKYAQGFGISVYNFFDNHIFGNHF